MSKSKKQLEEELAVVQQQLAEATSSTQPAAVSQAVSADAPPTWLQHLLTSQTESQRQLQESQLQMQQLLSQLLVRETPTTSNSGLQTSTPQPARELELNRTPKADAQKPSILNVGLSLAEFTK